MVALTAPEVLKRDRRARARRAPWERTWQECYEFALPQRLGAVANVRPGERKAERLFDGTAPDAVDQLAATLMAHLTPPGGRWFALTAGPVLEDVDRREFAAELERSTSVLLSHFDRSNFAVEVHQCYLDLVTVGTACLMFEEAPPGDLSAFRFTAVPLSQVAFEDGASGRLDATFRRVQLSAQQLQDRYPKFRGSDAFRQQMRDDSERKVEIVEAVVPDGTGYTLLSVLSGESQTSSETVVLGDGRFGTSPFISFRWMKAPGEIYGRSPVMKALPDIKTANKVVELILKNASIAVTGIWQADDDGILNPAAIKLAPGTIIPKAVGSAGLTPLAAPGRFDVSELVLDQLRERIRKAMFVDQLGQINGPRMTATEVLERSAEMARVLGATYGRLQTEFISPLVDRGAAILARRGEIADLPLDGRTVVLEFHSPQTRFQAQQDAQNTLLWLSSVRELGVEASAVVDVAAAARWLAEALGVPGELLQPKDGPLADIAAVVDASLSDVLPLLDATVTGDAPAATAEVIDG